MDSMQKSVTAKAFLADSDGSGIVVMSLIYSTILWISGSLEY
jgi:hypothetical protein